MDFALWALMSLFEVRKATPNLKGGKDDVIGSYRKHTQVLAISFSYRILLNFTLVNTDKSFQTTHHFQLNGLWGPQYSSSPCWRLIWVWSAWQTLDSKQWTEQPSTSSFLVSEWAQHQFHHVTMIKAKCKSSSHSTDRSNLHIELQSLRTPGGELVMMNWILTANTEHLV